MKNETARREIESLDYYLQNHTNDYSEESHTAMMMAIDALSKQQESNCEDIATAFQFGITFGFAKKFDEMDKVMEEIKKAITPQPKTGHWIISKDKSRARCSNCNFLLKDKDEIKLFGTFIQGYRYCSYCGAKMVEPQESEE